MNESENSKPQALGALADGLIERLADRGRRAQEERQAAEVAAGSRLGRGRHHTLARRTEGRVGRMRAGGAPSWLVAAESQANEQGFTMRTLPGCSGYYYRIPLESNESYAARAELAQRERLEAEKAEREGYERAKQARGHWDHFDDVFDDG